MAGVNKVIIMGRLGKDPELKYLPNGTAACKFSVATSESWTDKSGQKQEKTEWHNVVVWAKLAELCNQYLAKGRQVYLEGKLQTDSWEDNNGNKRYSTSIIASTIQFIGSKEEGNRPQGNAGAGKGGQAPAQDNSHFPDDASFAADDIPF